MRGKVDCFGISDIGCVRSENQDQYLIADLRKTVVVHHSSLGYDSQTEIPGATRARLMMVADGMGGHAGGQRASWLAVEGIVHYLLTNLHWPIHCEPNHEAEFFRGLHAALLYSQGQIRTVAEHFPSQNHMGTTLTMAWIVWPHTYLIHVGDSRAYLLRDGKLELLSHDQTMAQALIDQGLIKPSDATAKQFSNVLTSSLGCSTSMEPLYSRRDLEPEDKLLICSDGLTTHLSDTEIEKILCKDEPAKVACQRLVDAAKIAGGRDNITVALARFTTRDLQPDETMLAEASVPDAVV
ncbi:MAG: protein phosphatase 2C domain-containing protein [Pirellulaceae bacterium]